jgi:hypothetical protein
MVHRSISLKTKHRVMQMMAAAERIRLAVIISDEEVAVVLAGLLARLLVEPTAFGSRND